MKKKLLIILFISSIIYSSKAQKAPIFHEIGPWAGVAYYIGDINTSQQFYSTNYCYGGLHRFVFNYYFNVKTSVVKAKLSGNDLDFDNYYQQMRNHQFQTDLMEVASQLEFNFLGYTCEMNEFYFSPYVSAGVGVITTSLPNEGAIPIIPFGFGFKYCFADNWTLGAEWNFKKTFTDNLDNLDHTFYLEESDYFNKQKYFKYNQDWYSTASVYVTYRLNFNQNKCRSYGYRSYRHLKK